MFYVRRMIALPWGKKNKILILSFPAKGGAWFYQSPAQKIQEEEK
jgi:hypothetical protein